VAGSAAEPTEFHTLWSESVIESVCESGISGSPGGHQVVVDGSAMCYVFLAPAAIYVFQLSTLYDVIESWVPTVHKLTTMNLLGLVPRFYLWQA
jgi:hypothetical protein